MGPRPDDQREGGFTDRLVSSHPWKHRRLLLLALAGMALVLLAWLAVCSHGRKLQIAGFAKISRGMTQAQVEELLGGPPGDYGDNQGGVAPGSLESGNPVPLPPGSVTQFWFDDSHQFKVFFDR